MAEKKVQKVSVWDNWKVVTEYDKDMVPAEAVKDTRSGFYCIHDKMDLESYVNYLNVFMGYMNFAAAAAAKTWRRPIAGPVYMRSLGFVPVTAVPSYWGDEVVRKTLLQFQNSRIPLYSRPYLGTIDTIYENKAVGSMPDWWVSKLDISERTGIPVGRIGVKEVFRACGVTLP